MVVSRQSQYFHCERFYRKDLSAAPITSALLQDDCEALGAALLPHLTQASAINCIRIEATEGDAYTGGRSTPIYRVSCRIERKRDHAGLERKFVIKFVNMLNITSNDTAEDIFCPDLDHLRRSYANEHRFYRSSFYDRISEVLALPRLVAADFDGTKPSRPWVCLVLNDVKQQQQRHSSSGKGKKSFPIHLRVLSLDQTRQALHYLAHWHAIGWGCSCEDEPASTRLWPQGGFWNAKRHLLAQRKQSGSPITAAWARTFAYLKKNHPQLITERTKSIGSRLQALEKPLVDLWKDGRWASSFRTLIHGDFKSANLFFRETTDEDSVLHESVCAVDFQYTGHGLGAFDVAYFLYPDARSAWEEDDEGVLLHAYHDAFTEALILHGKGGPSTYPYMLFQAHYQLVQLDLTCYWMRKSNWAASTKGEAKLVARLECFLDKIDDGFLLKKEQYDDILQCYLADTTSC